jgi:hypothetical protein
VEELAQVGTRLLLSRFGPEEHDEMVAPQEGARICGGEIDEERGEARLGEQFRRTLGIVGDELRGTEDAEPSTHSVPRFISSTA